MGRAIAGQKRLANAYFDIERLLKSSWSEAKKTLIRGGLQYLDGWQLLELLLKKGYEFHSIVKMFAKPEKVHLYLLP